MTEYHSLLAYYRKKGRKLYDNEIFFYNVIQIKFGGQYSTKRIVKKEKYKNNKECVEMERPSNL